MNVEFSAFSKYESYMEGKFDVNERPIEFAVLIIKLVEAKNGKKKIQSSHSLFIIRYS